MIQKMSDWKEYKLGEVCSDINYGYTASANLNAIGPKFLRITDIVPERINWETVPFCEINDVNEKKYKLEKGDIVIARTGATTGYNAIIKESTNAVFASYLIRYRVKNKIANPFYIGYLLKSYEWKGFVQNVMSGSAQPGANAKQFADFDFELPPYQLQDVIVSILSSLDNKIDLLHRQNKTLEQLAETLFRQWFVEEAEESWEKNNINSIASVIQYGYTQSASEEKVGPKFLRITDIQGGVINWDTVPYCKINEKEIHKYKLKTGDIVVARTGASTGENIYLHKPEESVFASYLIRLQFSNLYLARFIGLLMRSYEYRGYIEGILSGSAQPNANASELTSFQVQIPSPEKLQVFYKKITELDEKKYSNNNQIKTLTQLRDTLLPKLMSGEVRTKI